MNNKNFSSHIELKNTKINDKFWNEKIELVRKEVIPYQYEALHDRVDGAEKSYCIENFKKAAKAVKAIMTGKELPVYPADKWCYDEMNCDPNAFHGWVFQDSDVYKWLEAVAYSLVNCPDEALEKKADECIDLICSAQLDNGYLDTLYIINNRDEVFSNLKDFHELYCFGHLAQAAAAYYKATGKRKLLDAACDFADLICDTFGENKIKGYPGHEIAEMALVELFDLTGKNAYLETALFFINERGKKPYYYDIVLGRETKEDNYHYNQAHKEPRKQTEAVGHAVRGVYLFSAMADIAKRTADEELYDACIKLFDSIENKKMYITGGIGATVDGEAFSFNFDLPNDLAYSETCASIGLIFFAMRMLEISPDAHFADVIERALYNTVLSSMAEDGKAFFYVNPLEVLPEASQKDSRKRHVKPVRQKWFSCACCPPNLARLISSIGKYCLTENDDTVFIHQYIGGSFKAKNADVIIESDYLSSGKVKIKIHSPEKIKLALRVPSWCRNFSFSKKYEMKNGYAVIELCGNEEIEAEFEIKPRLIKCSNKVRENIGKAAISCGPFIYCFEEADNGKNLHLLSIDKNTAFEVKDGFILADGYKETESTEDGLYFDYKDCEKEPVKLRFIPYYTWGNRGENEMAVYIRIEK